MEVGAISLGDGNYQFTLWAPAATNVSLRLVSPQQRDIAMEPQSLGYWRTTASDLEDGTNYYVVVDDNAYPDPASRYQPDGVHGPSATVDHHRYEWHDTGWRNQRLSDYIIYELHVGTFTPAGTFTAAIDRLATLKELGITAIEIMPVSQFAGERNWGYDGVYPYAVQNSYGGPEALKQFVDACHQQEIAVVMDVVYNHFGPEGNYTGNIGPYTTSRYNTPWGSAINFDDAWCDGVRRYFAQNALAWLRDYHIDALRLDAIHTIYDFGATHFLADLADQVKALSDEREQPFYLIAESDLNDTRVIRDRAAGGHAIDAQWSDDFHHALHSLLTEETNGYYSDFGRCEDLAAALRDRFVYNWKYSPFRQRFHGSPATDLPASQFVICAQNHDQVGNRMLGERLSHLVPFAGLKLAAGILLTAPYVPMLFMGEEYGEESPFLYFVDHGDPDLIAAVRQGRAAEFKDFQYDAPTPDPGSKETYEKSKLVWDARQSGKQQQLWTYYQQLIQLRKQFNMADPNHADDLQVVSQETPKVLYYQRPIANGKLLCLMNFDREPAKIAGPDLYGSWQKQIDSADAVWGGDGATLPDILDGPEPLVIPPLGFALFSQRY